MIGRIVVTLEDESEWPAVRERLSCLPGIENFSLARHAPLDLDAITAAIVRHLPDRPVSSFRIRARRADKRFPHPTPDIERHIGRLVLHGERLVQFSGPARAAQAVTLR